MNFQDSTPYPEMADQTLLERGFNLVDEQYDGQDDGQDMGPSDAELLEAANGDPCHMWPDKSFLGWLLGKDDGSGLDHWVPRPMLRELDLWAAQKGVGRAKALKLFLGKRLEAEKARRPTPTQDEVTRMADTSQLNQPGSRIL